MEKGCILPHEILAKLSTPDNVVLESLARFCKTSKENLLEVFKRRNTPANPKDKFKKNIHYGYKKFQVSAGGTKAKNYDNTEKKKKLREIREPIPALKAIQKTIKERLMQIPISLDASSGPKKSAEKNADLHRNNPYLITIDLKNAFPSVNTNRVYTNFKGALRHALDIWTPLLQDENNEITKENKKLFLRALTHLCVSENEIPQGAPTSPQIQHIVMSKTDSEIAKTLPEFLGHYRGVYSRYVDDLAVSFKQYPTKDVLEEKFTTYAQNIEHFKSDPTTLTQILQQFENDTFIATDKFERTFITQKVEELKKLINSAQISSEKKYQYIGQLNAYKQKISPGTYNIDNLKDAVIKAIGNQGRKINSKKIHVRTPQSNTDREINGLVFDKEGYRGLNTKTQSIYKKIFKDMIKRREDELENNTFYRHKFHGEMCESNVQNMLRGIYKYITRVYGNDRIPKELRELFEQAMNKWKDYNQRENEGAQKERKEFFEKDRKEFIQTMLGKTEIDDDLPF